MMDDGQLLMRVVLGLLLGVGFLMIYVCCEEEVEVSAHGRTSLPRPAAGAQARIWRYIVVDKFGRGSYTSLQAAIDSIPSGNGTSRGSGSWVHIYVRAGYYIEKVNIAYDKPYIILQGEGLMRTVIVWGDRAASSYGTANSATFTANAPNFIARGISFMNTAAPPSPGAYGGQAVAALLAADKMALYECGFHGAQDTLFDYEGRHYFRNCLIEGSIDFIFGHAQSIYKGCTLLVRAQAGYLSGAITAQSRNASQETSGFIFANCTILGKGEAVLGRAWGAYSRVVFMFTYMSDVISPQGWDDWGSYERQRTVYYGEYKCFGPGANLEYRVPWSHELNDVEAQALLQLSSINSDEWLLEI
ncbi:hypothetical protein L7F22_039480 [Adiantum nelumboides]|nr:hypothetical protein [Adiantum nelumboides]